MALTKERKILIAVAGLACGIFLLDRVLMGGTMSGPTQAQAAGPSAADLAQASAESITIQATADAATTLPVSLDFSTPAQAVPSLAQRLAHAGRHLPTETPNAFRPSARWQTPAEPDTADVASPAFNPRTFADRNPLDAVFASPQGATAMVAGQALRRGDVRDGMTLTDIGDRWVIWSGDGVRIKVHLDPVR